MVLLLRPMESELKIYGPTSSNVRGDGATSGDATLKTLECMKARDHAPLRLFDHLLRSPHQVRMPHGDIPMLH